MPSIFSSLPQEFNDLLLQAETCLANNEYKKANELYRQIADTYPDFSDGWYGLARSYLMISEYKHSVDCYMFTLDVEPNFDPYNNLCKIFASNPELIKGFSNALLEKGAYEESLRYVNYGLGLDPDLEIKVELLQFRDVIFAQKKKEEERLYQKKKKRKKMEDIFWAISTGFFLFLLFVMAGWFYLFVQDTRSRHAFIRGEYFYRIAQKHMKEFEKYKKNYEKAIQDLQNAREMYEESVKIDSNAYKSYYMLGIVYMRMREMEFLRRSHGIGFNKEKAARLLKSARLSYQKSVVYNPDFPDGYLELSRTYYLDSEKEKAMANCDMALIKAEIYYQNKGYLRKKFLNKREKLLERLKKLK